jgi:hypothetical protein
MGWSGPELPSETIEGTRLVVNAWNETIHKAGDGTL